MTPFPNATHHDHNHDGYNLSQSLTTSLPSSLNPCLGPQSSTKNPSRQPNQRRLPFPENLWSNSEEVSDGEPVAQDPDNFDNLPSQTRDSGFDYRLVALENSDQSITRQSIISGRSTIASRTVLSVGMYQRTQLVVDQDHRFHEEGGHEPSSAQREKHGGGYLDPPNIRPLRYPSKSGNPRDGHPATRKSHQNTRDIIDMLKKRPLSPSTFKNHLPPKKLKRNPFYDSSDEDKDSSSGLDDTSACDKGKFSRQQETPLPPLQRSLSLATSQYASQTTTVKPSRPSYADIIRESIRRKTMSSSSPNNFRNQNNATAKSGLMRVDNTTKASRRASGTEASRQSVNVSDAKGSIEPDISQESARIPRLDPKGSKSQQGLSKQPLQGPPSSQKPSAKGSISSNSLNVAHPDGTSKNASNSAPTKPETFAIERKAATLKKTSKSTKSADRPTLGQTSTTKQPEVTPISTKPTFSKNDQLPSAGARPNSQGDRTKISGTRQKVPARVTARPGISARMAQPAELNSGAETGEGTGASGISPSKPRVSATQRSTVQKSSQARTPVPVTNIPTPDSSKFQKTPVAKPSSSALQEILAEVSTSSQAKKAAPANGTQRSGRPSTAAHPSIQNRSTSGKDVPDATPRRNGQTSLPSTPEEVALDTTTRKDGPSSSPPNPESTLTSSNMNTAIPSIAETQKSIPAASPISEASILHPKAPTLADPKASIPVQPQAPISARPRTPPSAQPKATPLKSAYIIDSSDEDEDLFDIEIPLPPGVRKSAPVQVVQKEVSKATKTANVPNHKSLKSTQEPIPLDNAQKASSSKPRPVMSSTERPKAPITSSESSKGPGVAVSAHQSSQRDNTATPAGSASNSGSVSTLSSVGKRQDATVNRAQSVNQDSRPTSSAWRKDTLQTASTNQICVLTAGLVAPKQDAINKYPQPHNPDTTPAAPSSTSSTCPVASVNSSCTSVTSPVGSKRNTLTKHPQSDNPNSSPAVSSSRKDVPATSKTNSRVSTTSVAQRQETPAEPQSANQGGPPPALPSPHKASVSTSVTDQTKGRPSHSSKSRPAPPLGPRTNVPGPAPAVKQKGEISAPASSVSHTHAKRALTEAPSLTTTPSENRNISVPPSVPFKQTGSVLHDRSVAHETPTPAPSSEKRVEALSSAANASKQNGAVVRTVPVGQAKPTPTPASAKGTEATSGHVKASSQQRLTTSRVELNTTASQGGGQKVQNTNVIVTRDKSPSSSLQTKCNTAGNSVPRGPPSHNTLMIAPQPVTSTADASKPATPDVIQLDHLAISPPQEPYFEYTIQQKLWPSGSQNDVQAMPIGTPSTVLKTANDSAEKLFAQAKQQLGSAFLMLHRRSEVSYSEEGGVQLLGTLEAADWPRREVCVRIWVERREVPAAVAAFHPPPKSTPFISKKLFILRLHKLTDDPNAESDAEDEGQADAKEGRKDADADETSSSDSSSSSSSSSDEETNSSPSARKYAKKRRAKVALKPPPPKRHKPYPPPAHPCVPARKHRHYHPLPSTELYTSLPSANTAAYNLQLALSHEARPRTAFQAAWQESDGRALLRRLVELDGKEGAERMWRSEFNGVGGVRFEVLVEGVRVAGARNV